MHADDLIQHIDSIATYSPPLHDGTVNRRLVDPAVGAGIEVIQGRLAPGGTASRHKHKDAWQIILVQSGRARVSLGDDVVQEVGPGTVIRIPPMMPHQVEILGEETAELIVIYNPPVGPDGFIPA
ncbi:cupin domain-containing protein [Thalassobaculum sp.]|uniref:cupin domain-containing protein n=1 Tax=Thalassobaculum sp. TaxID=2022740 RepID=UPI0032EF3F8E